MTNLDLALTPVNPPSDPVVPPVDDKVEPPVAEVENEIKIGEDGKPISAVNEEIKQDDVKEGEVEAITPIAFTDLTFAEGADVTEEGAAPFLEIMNDAEMTGGERAQKLLDLFSTEMDTRTTALLEGADKQFVEMSADWLKELKTDKIIGNANYTKTMASVNELIDAHGSKELRELFNLTGAGSNVHMMRFLHNISTANAESTPLDETGGESNDSGYKPVGNRLYPTKT